MSTGKPTKSPPGQGGKVYPPSLLGTANKVMLPDERSSDAQINIGDDFAVWVEDKEIILIVPKSAAVRKRIPKTAHWGEVERTAEEAKAAK